MHKKSPLLAVVFGMSISLLILIGLEILFQINHHLNFFPQQPVYPYYSYPTKKIPAHLEKELKKRWPHSIRLVQPGSDDKLDYSLKYDFKNTFKESIHPSPAFFRLKSNIKTQSIIKLKPSQKIVYDLWYQTDEEGRRKLPNRKTETSKHLLLLGGSNAWGDGVEDHKIYPYFLQEHLKDHELYLAARSSFGPNDLLDNLIHDGWVFRSIKQKKGIALYLFVADHINRAFPPLQTIRRFPYISYKTLYKKKNGRLVAQGSFRDISYYKALSFLGRSEFLKYFGVSIPLNHTEKAINLTVEILLEIERRLQNKFGTKELVLLIFDKHGIGDILEKKWLARGKVFFDYSQYDFASATGNKERFPHDGHPTELTHWLLSQLIIEDLKKLNLE